ncbi:class I SAM-dependent methyltransferase [Actinoplanes sp. CA-030573]|uniref:class I SAM-dependent methyltransferase n=1 Tax=Actinoplanes sp. CA-030573 TaxID=3239898 RepID=UPI003D8EAD34
MSDEQAWDERYRESDRIWSGNPNEALVAEVADLPPGRALDLGCGEGADAVWLAKRGWQVTAVDISGVALERAAAHARDAGVTVTFERHDLTQTFPEGAYDLVSVQFLHSWQEFDREKVLRRAAESVAAGGVYLIEGHMDHGPFRHEGHQEGNHESNHEGHHEVRFPTPDEVITSLDLGAGWEVLTAEIHPRTQTGPDGAPAKRTDATVKLRRIP